MFKTVIFSYNVNKSYTKMFYFNLTWFIEKRSYDKEKLEVRLRKKWKYW